MSGCDEQSTGANQVSSRTVDTGLGCREVRNATTVLLVLCISKEHNTFDLILQRSAQTRDGTGHECCALRVSSSGDGCVGAFAGSELEETLAFSDGGR